MIPNSVMIAIQDIKSQIPEEGDLIDKLKFSMAQARDHWLVTIEDHQFRAAVGAVMLYYGQESPEYKRLEYEMNILNKLSALITAAQVGLSIDPESLINDQEKQERVGLLDLWKSTI